MSLRIIKQGILDTLQDAGRIAFQHLGINPGGAMDLLAMKLANLLAGNGLNEAVLEMHFPAPAMLFEDDAVVALSGADWDATINNVSIQLNRPLAIQKDSVLQFRKNKKGARCYLSIYGGIEANEWLGSKSTNLKVNMGGFAGRILRKNDVLRFNKRLDLSAVFFEDGCKRMPWSANPDHFYPDSEIHFIPGEAFQFCNEKSKRNLIECEFTLSPKSDRMACYLVETLDDLPEMEERISASVTRGSIQLLPNGQLIILMADHQTTGGYPVVGCVTSISLSTLAQKRAGEKISFAISTIGEAEKKLLQLETDLRQLQNACTFRLQTFLQATNAKHRPEL